MSLCPCGSGAGLAECCGPIIDGTKAAPTAEALMRARYTAHATGAFDFLETSIHSSTREAVDTKKMRQWAEAVAWTGMDVHAAEGGGENDAEGRVSFTARYSVNGIEQELREDAVFVREDGEWKYLNGDVQGHTPYRRETPKVGRNDPCPCGSGNKYKKCGG
ncbi:MAG: YchJ family protein [Deltaproteobacteria bacterium]|jgi:SEC-C motif-containing protein|nr:YchJ family protein [Deltaproteobacteria bacterium]